MKAVGRRGSLCCMADAFRLGVVCFCWCAMWAGRVAEGTKMVEHACYTGLDPATATGMECWGYGLTGAFYPDVFVYNRMHATQASS